MMWFGEIQNGFIGKEIFSWALKTDQTTSLKLIGMSSFMVGRD